MGEPLERGEVYNGPCGVLKDSAWLSSETIPHDQDTIVQIDCVIRRREVKFKNETKKGYGSLRFVGKDRELGLNATHIAVLSRLFGNDTTNWRKQYIALYVDPDVQSFGKTVCAVRIRARKVEVPKGKGMSDRPEAAPADDVKRAAMLAELNAMEPADLRAVQKSLDLDFPLETLKPDSLARLHAAAKAM